MSQPWCLTTNIGGDCASLTCLSAGGFRQLSLPTCLPHLPFFILSINFKISETSETGETSSQSTGIFLCLTCGWDVRQRGTSTARRDGCWLSMPVPNNGLQIERRIINLPNTPKSPAQGSRYPRVGWASSGTSPGRRAAVPPLPLGQAVLCLPLRQAVLFLPLWRAVSSL